MERKAEQNLVFADDGFYFGLGLFETLAAADGRLLLEGYHRERLLSAMERLEIPVPPGGWPEIRARAAAVMADFEERHPAERENYVVKVCVTARNLTVTARPNHYTEEQYRRGFHLEYSPVRRNETSPLTFCKTLNYGDNILEKRRANREGFDEPVFLNQRGLLTEGATTNLFGVLDGAVVTPSLACGLLPGTVRRYLLERCPVREMELSPAMFSRCSEVFVTNALLGIMPVSQFGEHQFAPGPVTACLWKMYQAECRKAPGREI